MLDPNNIRFNRRHPSVRELLDLVPASLDVPVTPEDVTALVELLLVNGPMPAVVLSEAPDGTVVRLGAGARFVSALRAFAGGARLGETAWVVGWAGKGLDDLEPWAKRRFFRRDVDVTLIEPGTTAPVADAVFAALARG